jgi:hypothetical protein
MERGKRDREHRDTGRQRSRPEDGKHARQPEGRTGAKQGSTPAIRIDAQHSRNNAALRQGYKDVPTSCLCLRLGLAIAAWLDNYKAFKWAIAAKEVGPLSRPTVSGCEGVAGDYSGVKSLAGDFLDEWMQNLSDNFR